jgi:outer membrane protein OmpA-like peptidoglycan-associated protein
MKISAQLAALLLFLQVAQAQTLNGLSTGNYAGIVGLSFNPASIVDSRYKFDLNIAAAQYYFTNNYLYAKPLLFARRYLSKSPYNSSFAAVQEDLMTPKIPTPESKVYGRQNTEFLFPLSFMLTTGKRSAIALSLRNRYDISVNNLNPQTAEMLWSELRDPSLHGVSMKNDGFETNFMNWQEVGFTYGRVLMNANKHFFKFAVTGKWLGGNAAGFIQADELSVQFSSPTTLSMQSPAMQYARTSRADFGLFNRRSIVSDIQASNFGFDAGLVYEFRGRVANFRYTDEDYQSRLRRDMNKYTFRVGLTLNDVGVLNFDRMPLTRDHSAAINNWDFGGVKANNISEWDTAYSKQVKFDPNSPQDFSVSLPTAAILNVDWHLFKGFYVNAAIQRRIPKLEKPSTARMFAGEWFAITPRFEGRQFGFYVPLLIRPDYTQIGATVRFGPFYIGSNNLLALIQNAQVASADVHAGFRIPIGFGKPTKLLMSLENKSGLKISDDYERQMETVTSKTNALETRIAILEKMADSAYRTPPTLIVNNYVVDSAGKPKLQTQVAQTSGTSTRPPAAAGYTKAQVDSINAENEKLRKEVEKRMKEDGVTPPRNPKPTKNERRALKRQERFEREQRQYQREVQNEMRRTRRQQAATGAAITGAIAANAVVNANSGAQGDTVVVRDTVVVEKVKRDTVYVKDTVQTSEQTAPGPTQKRKPQLSPDKTAIPELRTARIFFASGSAAINGNYTSVLNKVAAWMLKYPDRRVLITGVTDATGSASVNRALAQRRIDATIKALVSRGIDASRFEQELNIATTKSANASAPDRRVDISALQ